MTKIAILGASGRMGQAILGQAVKDKTVSLAALVDRTGGKTPDGRDVTADLDAALNAADVLIDFTGPEATLLNAPKVAKAGKAYVVGTTGLVGDKRAAFVAAVKGIPVVLSSNMSLSANVMFDVAERVARALPGYDNEIVEIHHNLKKDSPSGTAQTLAESVQRGKGLGDFVYGRQGLVGERKASEIGVHAVRGGDVVGDHTVLFLGAGERIELVHRVTSRDAFAQGAVVAAKWLVQNKKPAGLYDMRDVLGLK
jgi:4-hydroxy-tetrahydrodipicolinate reductase